jgi:hypothetical protein
MASAAREGLRLPAHSGKRPCRDESFEEKRRELALGKRFAVDILCKD